MMRRLALASLLLVPVFVHSPVAGQTRCITTTYRYVTVVYHTNGSYTRTEEITRITTCSPL
jgi:hypothetical protein